MKRCNSSTDGSFRSLQFLHFHFQPPDKLSGRCLHRRYFSLMRRWAEDGRRKRGGWGRGAVRRRGRPLRWEGCARRRLPIKLRLNKTEVDVGRNQTAETARLAPAPRRRGSNGPARAAQEQVGNKEEVFQVSEGKFSAASALGVPANWPSLAFGGRRRALAVSGGWWRSPAGGTAGDGRSCLIVNHTLLLPPLCCRFCRSWRRLARRGDAEAQTKEDGCRFLEEVSSPNPDFTFLRHLWTSPCPPPLPLLF